MDWMVQEQERGITITSAATTCFWTPENGPHEGTRTASTSSTRPATSTSPSRSSARLRVLDGAVAVFDGGNGVEPQSETVWRQADKYNVPRIASSTRWTRSAPTSRCASTSIRERLGANAGARSSAARRGGRSSAASSTSSR